MNDPCLEVENLNVNYGKTPVLWDISLTIPQGKLVGIIGPNGAGKSTFLKAILGLTPLLSGRISLFGSCLKKERVAYVPQRGSVDWDFPITALEVVLMGRFGKLGLFKRPRQADRLAALEALSLVGMADLKDRQIGHLSGGQQQRLFIARALLQNADVLFLDEPFAGVDLSTEKAMIALLKEQKGKGKTIFIVHHDLPTVSQYFDWSILLNTRLIAAGPVQEVVTQDNLAYAFGKNQALFEEAARLSAESTSGII